MRKRAFTLVELLVVIAIIALLIAILAPSLKAAKDVAKFVYCKSTINALNNSVFVYAENYRGFMMVYLHKHRPKTTSPYMEAADQSWRTAVCFAATASGIDPNTGLLGDARGYGIVYAQKLLGPAEMFYCPDPNPQDQRACLDWYPKPWGTQTASGSSFIRNSYMWNPWIMRNPVSASYWVYEDSLMLSRHPNSRFLTSDLLNSYKSMRHLTGVSARWNMGYTDGHVSTFESGRVGGTVTLYSMLLDRQLESTNWTGSDGYNDQIRPMIPQ